jgi:hypothetical protein
MQWQMACLGADWCDFVSYDDRFPVGAQIFIKRVERDNDLIAEIQNEVLLFLEELTRKQKEFEEILTGGVL